jgi:hypothetical protein
MTTAAIETTEAPDLDAIERDAQAQVEALEDQRQRLAPEALVSAQAKGDLADCESELAEARRALELVGLARQEDSRREAEAIEAEEADRRAKALGEARKLGGKREAAAKAVDDAADAFAEALSSWSSVKREQEMAFDRAGRHNAPKPAKSATEATFVRALHAAGTPGECWEFGHIPARPRLLVESEPSQHIEQ